MFSIKKNAKVVFVSKPTNLLSGIIGLSALVTYDLKMEIDSSTYFLFTNFKRNWVKILYLDGTNLAVWVKRLDGTLAFKFSNKIIIFNENEVFHFLGKITSRSYYEFEKVDLF
jgi:hypothetical protein